MSAQQLEMASDAQRIATLVHLRGRWQGLLQVFVAEAVKQETTLTDHFKETAFPGTDWLQGPEAARGCCTG